MQHLSEGALLQGGKYKIKKVLGQGGFGITYLATHKIMIEGSIGQIGTEVKLAVKEFFIKDICNRDEESNSVSIPSVGSKQIVERFKQKFIKEAKNISNLNHPHIIKVVDVFEENDTAYYVMEYHSGGSLADLVRYGKALPEADAIKYITQIANAVDYIHKRKINHLDIKPGNIMLNDEGVGVLINFGLSKLYDDHDDQTSSTPVGISHGYAPMELYKQNGVSAFSPQTDIYALGATLYKLVTGTTPPQAMDILDEGMPALPQNISPRVRNAVAQAMQLRKSDRPATAEEFIALLGASGEAADSEETMVNALHKETVIDVSDIKVVSEPVKKTPVAPAEQPKKAEKPKENPVAPAEKPEPQKSNPWKWVAAAVVLLLLAVGGINWWGDYKAEQAAEAEQQRLAAIEQARKDSIAKARASEKEAAKKRKKYDYKDDYYEGLAAVRLNGKWGYIDKSGNVVIPLKYDLAYGVKEGLALVKSNGKYGFIDKSGNVVIPLKYDDAASFNEGLALVKLNGKCGFIDKSGNVVIPLKYDLAYGFKEGLAPVKLNSKWGFIDKNDNVVIPLKYDGVYNFSNGRAIVELNWKYGFIDKSGNEITPLKYDYADGFSNGRASVELNGKRGFIDKSGKVVVPIKYDFAYSFENGRAQVKLNGEWFYIDKNGNRID